MTQCLPRRQFLQRVGAGAAAIALARTAHVHAAESAARPNILFCIADDMSWMHTSIGGDPVTKTPAFDRVAREGALCNGAYTVCPSCSPSRACILTGQHTWRLKEGGNLWGTLPREFDVYPDLLEAAGYHVGFTGKGWGPGQIKPGGRDRNPAGRGYRSFNEFFKSIPAGKPFCFWFGSNDPHRPYDTRSGVRSGKKLADVRVPAFLPDSPEVRSDILDYIFEVERYDQQVGQILARLEEAAQLDNTLVVITSDNGMPFPRAKTNLYDSGAHMPLAIRYPRAIKAGRVIDDLISFVDFAPTFLDVAGLKAPPAMTGRSFWNVLTSDKSGQVDRARNRLFLARERHAQARAGNVGYPVRAVRTREFLYIRNLAPDRWPAGDPGPGTFVDRVYGDIDGGPSKTYLMNHRDDPAVRNLFHLAFEKRPAQELYDLKLDPDQLNNVAETPSYSHRKQELRAILDLFLMDTKDPRIVGGEVRWDEYPYYGGVPAAATRPARR